MVIPPSIYNKPVSKIPEHKYCLVVDDDNELVKEYELLCKDVHPFVSIVHVPQKDAAKYAKSQKYDCIIVDNDSFRIGEYRGLETIKSFLRDVSPEKIIYTSALPDDKMRTTAAEYCIKFVEKGGWRKLEATIRELFASKDEPIFSTSN